MAKKGKLNVLLIGLDLIGFALIFTGTALIRFSSSDISSIIGGFVLAGDVAVLSPARVIPK